MFIFISAVLKVIREKLHGLLVFMVGVLPIWAPVGPAPFPVQGLIPVSFVRECRVSIAASLCKSLKFLCLVMVLCMEETLVISACFVSNIS